jgi:transketolase
MILRQNEARYAFDGDRLDYYESLSKKVRRIILEMIYRSGSPHIGPSFSVVEILVTLYWNVLLVDPSHPLDADRDRFILSKGHGCPALYAVLAEKGFLSDKDLQKFAVNDGLLEQHPNRDVGRGVEVSTGSLGHGLSIGTGMALAAKGDQRRARVFVLLGDGELNEGSVWEAAMFASHHCLDNLVAIVDYNGMQALGRTEEVISLEPLADKWASFGWSVREIDGHDYSSLFSVCREFPFSKHSPSVIIAHTIKGHGVSFMEDKLLWHYRCPDELEYQMALRELSE